MRGVRDEVRFSDSEKVYVGKYVIDVETANWADMDKSVRKEVEGMKPIVELTWDDSKGEGRVLWRLEFGA